MITRHTVLNAIRSKKIVFVFFNKPFHTLFYFALLYVVFHLFKFNSNFTVRVQQPLQVFVEVDQYFEQNSSRMYWHV